MVRSVRVGFAALAWVYFAAVIFQVFLAGVGLFGTAEDSFEPHRGVGFLLSLAPILLLLVAFAARVPRMGLWLTVGLVVTAFVQSILPGLRADLPLVAALHPVNALLIAGHSISVVREATAHARQAVLAPVAQSPGSAV